MLDLPANRAMRNLCAGRYLVNEPLHGHPIHPVRRILMWVLRIWISRVVERVDPVIVLRVAVIVPKRKRQVLIFLFLIPLILQAVGYVHRRI